MQVVWSQFPGETRRRPVASGGAAPTLTGAAIGMTPLKPGLRTTYMLIGAALGAGAPAGRLLLRLDLSAIISPDTAVAELDASRALYAYMLVSTSSVFGLFGFVLGVRSERRRARNRVLKAAAIRDPLTGLVNRRFFDELFGHLVSGAERNRWPVSLVMADIDDFKAVNDTFGHQMGDEVLREVARVITDAKRQPDLAARYGGEEFLIALPETSIEVATVLAERLRERVETLEVEWRGARVRVTASFGVAGGTPQGTEWPIHAICEADSALYVAKTTGKNRVVGRRLLLSEERGV